MKEILYGPGEIIYSEKEVNDRIFFIHNGLVEFYIQTSDTETIASEH